jgi:NMD protein affecting ribosome stability and mRNA decay
MGGRAVKFKKGDIIKTNGEHFAEREIVGINKITNEYRTKFLEDGSIVETQVAVIDQNYNIK